MVVYSGMSEWQLLLSEDKGLLDESKFVIVYTGVCSILAVINFPVLWIERKTPSRYLIGCICFF